MRGFLLALAVLLAGCGGVSDRASWDGAAGQHGVAKNDAPQAMPEAMPTRDALPAEELAEAEADSDPETVPGTATGEPPGELARKKDWQ